MITAAFCGEEVRDDVYPRGAFGGDIPLLVVVVSGCQEFDNAERARFDSSTGPEENEASLRDTPV